jgi:hypothetical protein
MPVVTCYIPIKILCQWLIKIKFIYFVGVNFCFYLDKFVYEAVGRQGCGFMASNYLPGSRLIKVATIDVLRGASARGLLAC